MSLRLLGDADGGRSERCQWQDAGSINNAGPVGVRVHGTLRRDVLPAVCFWAQGLCTAVTYNTHIRGFFFSSYSTIYLPVRLKPARQQIELILDNPPRSPPSHSLPTHLLTHQPPAEVSDQALHIPLQPALHRVRGPPLVCSLRGHSRFATPHGKTYQSALSPADDASQGPTASFH